ncbi:MAG: rod shape-determining protein MreD [Candidatus Syntrophosphaera sp.]|nr:rod shape-determining protein MreD [Candidatus Syntrophosphaera sp.]
MIWKHIWTFILGLICLYVQLLAMPVFQLGGVIPNILIPWIVYLVWTREIKSVLVVAFLIGLLSDTTLPESFGLHAFIFVLIAFGADQFRKPFESESVVSKVLTLLMANIIFHLVGLLVLGVVYSFDAQLVRLTGIAFLYNFAVSFVAFWLMQFASRLRLVVVRD